LMVHFQTPVLLSEASAALAEAKLAQGKASVLGDAAATQGKDVFVEWFASGIDTTDPSKAKELSSVVRDAFAKLTDVNKQPVVLSQPFPEAQEIQGRMIGELRSAAVGALILSWILIAFYLRIRFHRFSFGVAAVVALIHDVLITFGVVVIANHLGLVHA